MRLDEATTLDEMAWRATTSSGSMTMPACRVPRGRRDARAALLRPGGPPRCRRRRCRASRRHLARRRDRRLAPVREAPRASSTDSIATSTATSSWSTTRRGGHRGQDASDRRWRASRTYALLCERVLGVRPVRGAPALPARAGHRRAIDRLAGGLSPGARRTVAVWNATHQGARKGGLVPALPWAALQLLRVRRPLRGSRALRRRREDQPLASALP